MTGQNPLMFQVGIERANKEYDKIKQEIEDLVKLGDSGITIKVKLEELGNLQDFIKALQLIGDDQGLKKLIQNVTILKSQLQDVEEQSKKAHKAMAETSKSNQDEKTKLKNADELEARLRRLQDAYSTLNQLRHTALNNSLPVGDIENRMRKILEFIQKVRELQRGDLSNKNLLSTATFDDKLIFGKVNSAEYFTSLKNEIKQLIELYDSLIKKKKDSDSVELRKGSITAEVNQVKVMTEAQKELKAAILDVINTRKIGKGLGLSTPNISKEYRETIQLYKELERHAQAGTYDESLINRLKEHLSLLRQINTAQKDANTNKKESGTASTINQETVATQKNTSAKNQNAAATQKLSIEEEQLTKSIQKGITAANHQSAVINDLKSMAQQYLGVWGAQSFLRNVIEIGGQLEMQRLSIGAILGDMAKANDLFDKIKSLAIKSPFGVVELDQMTKQLSAYGFEYKELFDMTKRLADISAATGTDVSRLALALGHVRSEAALSGYTLRQFSMANIPLAKKLSEQLSEIEGKFVSVADVRKRVRAKDIGYEEVLKVLKDLTDQGGMFFNAQEIMSESVKAKFKNLKDSMDIMYGEIAESSVGGGLKDLATLLTKLTRHWEELGAVILTVGGYWMTHKLAVIACNKAMVQGNLAMGAFSAKQLEAAAHTGNLTRAQLLQAVATKKLSVADAEAAGAVYLLSKAQLQHVANTGKVTSATNMASLATSKYTVSQLRLLATFRNTSWLSWTKYLTGAKVGLMGLATGAKAVGLAIGSMIRSLLPLLALSAVVELFVSWKRESDSFADAANNVGQSARQMMEDVNKAIRTAEKSGKPLDNTALRSSVNAMKEVLEQNEFYTEEQRKQVENAETLSKKYDILLAQLREMREEAQWMADSESLLKTILANTGKNINKGVIQNYNSQTGEYEYTESKSFGSKFFNKSLTENMDELNKHNSELNTAISLLSEYRDVMNTAIEKNKGFGLSLDGKSWQEQIKLIAESGHWDEFVASVENAGSRFNTTAENVKKASEKVRDDWDNIVKDDFEAIRLTLMEKFNLTEEGLDEFAKNNEKTVRWMVDGIVKTLSKLGAAEELLDSLKRKLLNLFNIDGGKKPTQKVPTEYDKQTDLGKRIVSNVIRNNKKNGKNGNGVTTVKEINQLTGTGDEEKTESEVIQSMKDNAQKALQRAKDIKKIYGESSKKYKDANKEYERLLNIATSNGISEDEIKTGKYKDKTDKSSGEDKDAKRLREIARLYKDAYDWYNKYEKQVGKGSALEKVQKQFQPLFDEFSKQFGQTLSLDSIPEYRENLTALLDEAMKIYSDPKHQNSYMVQAIQNIRDAINNVDYEEAQRKMDEYASSVQVKLDILSRAWDTFNTVRKATGNIGLAINIAGVEYQEGQHNIADALRKMVEDDFASLGVTAIPFSVTIDEKKLENDIKAAFETAKPKQMKGESDKEYAIRLSDYFSHIKGIVSEYKKWQDLQKEVEKGDVDTFSKLLSSAVDLKTQVAQIKDEYQEMIESLERLKRDGRIDRKDYHRSSSIASANMQMKLVQATNTYQLLIDGVVTINKKAAQSIRRDYINALEQQLKAGAITAKEYADKISDINDKMKKLEDNPSYLTSYMQGGLNGVFDNIMKRGHSMSESGASIMQNAQSMIDDSFSNGDFKQFTEGIKKMNSGKEMAQIGQGMEQMGGEMMQTVAIIDMIVHGINDLVQGFKDTYDEIREMHEALGDNTKSDSWEDWNTFFSSFSAASNSATKGWDSLKNGDVGGVISGVVGSWTNWITGFAKGHDQKNQNMIDRIGENIRALEMNTEAIKGARERTLGYDMGEINRRLSEYYMPNNRVNPHVTDHAFDGLKTSHIEHILFSLSYDMAQYYGNK